VTEQVVPTWLESGQAARVAAKTDGERQMDLFGAAS